MQTSSPMAAGCGEVYVKNSSPGEKALEGSQSKGQTKRPASDAGLEMGY
jgi:hypothetical protein